MWWGIFGQENFKTFSSRWVAKIAAAIVHLLNQQNKDTYWGKNSMCWVQNYFHIQLFMITYCWISSIDDIVINIIYINATRHEMIKHLSQKLFDRVEICFELLIDSIHILRPLRAVSVYSIYDSLFLSCFACMHMLYI